MSKTSASFFFLTHLLIRNLPRFLFSSDLSISWTLRSAFDEKIRIYFVGSLNYFYRNNCWFYYVFVVIKFSELSIVLSNKFFKIYTNQKIFYLWLTDLILFKIQSRNKTINITSMYAPKSFRAIIDNDRA